MCASVQPTASVCGQVQDVMIDLLVLGAAAGTIVAVTTAPQLLHGAASGCDCSWVPTHTSNNLPGMQEYSDYAGKFGAAAFGILAALFAVGTGRRLPAWRKPS